MTTTTEKTFPMLTIVDIERQERDRGSYWFEPDTMRFFSSRVSDTTYCGPGGIYFVTSEKPPRGPRAYTIRKYDPDTEYRCGISTVGEILDYPTRSKAHTEAKRLSGLPRVTQTIA